MLSLPSSYLLLAASQQNSNVLPVASYCATKDFLRIMSSDKKNTSKTNNKEDSKPNRVRHRPHIKYKKKREMKQRVLTDENRCTSLSKDGKQCNNYRLKGNEFCFCHKDTDDITSNDQEENNLEENNIEENDVNNIIVGNDIIEDENGTDNSMKAPKIKKKSCIIM